MDAVHYTLAPHAELPKLLPPWKPIKKITGKMHVTHADLQPITYVAIHSLPMSALPPIVPALCAYDICRGTYELEDNRRCLAGWVRHCFGDIDTPAYIFVCRALKQTAIMLEMPPITELGPPPSPDTYVKWVNDNPFNSEGQLAELWNKTMLSLGYVRDGAEFHQRLPEDRKSPVPAIAGMLTLTVSALACLATGNYFLAAWAAAGLLSIPLLIQRKS